MNFFIERATTTDHALDALAQSIRTELATDFERVMRKTCIYVVGSGGRGEMSSHSDVDVFIARVFRDPSEVDAFVLRHALARALDAANRPEPSQGGEFLRMHTVESLRRNLGSPADDASNTFTARMLLLLESRALVGTAAYRELVRSVLDGYWQDVQGHRDDYQPFVLVNDIVRYWRSLLLNYVAKNLAKEHAREDTSGERRLRSYKLRHSRALTCFSTLAALLALTARGGVRVDDVLSLVELRPLERLARAEGPATAAPLSTLRALYENFLRVTDAPKSELVARFSDSHFARERADEGGAFGDALFDLLLALGHQGRARQLFRHMVV